MINLSRVDLNLLVVLDAILAEGGVSRAGDQAQPHPAHDQPCAGAAARAVRRSAVRARRAAPRADAAHPAAVEPLRQSLLLARWRCSRRAGVSIRRGPRRFTVSMRDPMEVLILPRLMRRLAREAPGIDLRAVQVRRRSVETGLADGTLDAAFDVALPLSEQDPSPARERRPFRGRRAQGPSACAAGLHAGNVPCEKHVMVTSRRRGPGAEDIELGQQRTAPPCQPALP